MTKQLSTKWIAAISVGVIVGAGSGLGLLAVSPGAETPTEMSEPAARRSARSAASTTTTAPATVDTVVDPATDVAAATEIAPVDPSAAAIDVAATPTPVAGNAPAASSSSRGRTSGGTGGTASGSGASGSGASGSVGNTGATSGGSGGTSSGAAPAASSGSPAVAAPTPAPAPAPAATAPTAPRNARTRLGFAGTTATRAQQPLVVVVDWEAPASGDVGGYTVTCRKAGTSTGGTTLAAAGSARSVAFPSLPVGTAHACTVQAAGSAGVSPVAAASGTATPMNQPNPPFSAGSCSVGGPGGMFGERYLVVGPAPIVKPAGVTTATYWIQPSLGGPASQIGTTGGSGQWLSVDEYAGHYARRAGSSVGVWAEWTVSSGGTTFTLLSSTVTAPCS